MNYSLFAQGLALSSVLLTAIPQTLGAQLATCPGDCNGDRRVTIDELLVGTNILLGLIELAQCEALAEDVARIEDMVTAVNHALVGCPTPDPTVTPTPSELAAYHR